ncbi:hypothetical protein DFH28DRAFT_923199 [Melampsora americana]|nr:hypothetical protein DFH28DRAFT_923199 [Melampsora americana]
MANKCQSCVFDTGFVKCPRQGKDGESLFTCSTCPGGRMMRYDSIWKHLVRPAHVKHFDRWLAHKKAIKAAARTSENAAAFPHSSNDHEFSNINNNNGQIDSNTPFDNYESYTDQQMSMIDERQELTDMQT